MGNYKATHPYVDNTKLSRMYPEPNYKIKTRPPIKTGNSWRVNVLLKCREEELADQAMPIARRKCYDPVMNYLECQENQGMFWFVFNCQQDFQQTAECLEHEYAVEMDKKRRNISRNHEYWWKQFYNEQGQVGRQNQMGNQWSLYENMKYTFTGIEPQYNNSKYNYQS